MPRYQPLHSYSFPYALDRFADYQTILQFNSLLAQSGDPYLSTGQAGEAFGGGVVPDNQVLSKRLLIKETHCFQEMANVLRRLPEASLIGVVRNPVATIASWVNNPGEFRPEWSALEQWRDATLKNAEHPGNMFGFESWKKCLRELAELKKEFPDRVVVVKYEDLLKHRSRLFGKLYDFLGLADKNLGQERLQETSTYSSSHDHSVFRTQPRHGHGTLQPEIVQQIEREMGNVRNYTAAFGLSTMG